MAPRVFIFSTLLGAEYLSYVKSIETHARAFLTLIIPSIGTVIIVEFGSLQIVARSKFRLFVVFALSFGPQCVVLQDVHFF